MTEQYSWMIQQRNLPRRPRPVERNTPPTSIEFFSSRRAPSLPVELIRMIFDLLQPPHDSWVLRDPGAKRNLARCNLVCRQWHEIARSYLFRDFAYSFGNLVATHNRRMNHNERVIIPSYLIRQRDLSPLLLWLEENPTAAGAIQRLRLDYHDGTSLPKGCAVVTSRGRYVSYGEPRSCLTYDPAILLSVLRLLPRLRAVYLHNVVLTGPPSPDAEVCRSLEKLSVKHYNSMKDHFKELFTDRVPSNLLACFGKVQELEVIGRGSYVGDAENSTTAPIHLEVDSLVLQRCHTGSLVLKHLRNATDHSLTRLTLRFVELDLEDGTSRLFHRFLEEIGPRILELRVYLQHDHVRDGDQAIDIGYCPNVREVTFGFTLPIFTVVQCNRALDDLARLIPLAQLSSAKYAALQELILEITFDAVTFRQVSDPDEEWIPHCHRLDFIDKALSQAVDRCDFESVVFECRSLGDVDGQECAKKMFPRLHAQGGMLLRAPRPNVWQSSD